MKHCGFGKVLFYKNFDFNKIVKSPKLPIVLTFPLTQKKISKRVWAMAGKSKVNYSPGLRGVIRIFFLFTSLLNLTTVKKSQAAHSLFSSRGIPFRSILS